MGQGFGVLVVALTFVAPMHWPLDQTETAR
jgi:hypothetical protein